MSRRDEIIGTILRVVLYGVIIFAFVVALS